MIPGTKVGRRSLQNRDPLGVHNSKFIIGSMILKQAQTWSYVPYNEFINQS